MLRRSTFSVSISDLLFVLLCRILGNGDEDGYEAENLRIRVMTKMAMFRIKMKMMMRIIMISPTQAHAIVAWSTYDDDGGEGN